MSTGAQPGKPECGDILLAVPRGAHDVMGMHATLSRYAATDFVFVLAGKEAAGKRRAPRRAVFFAVRQARIASFSKFSARRR